MKYIKSFFVTIRINAERIIDHIWRRITGLPQLKHSEINHDIFLGGQFRLRGVSTMKKLGITGIINMRKRALYDTTLKDTFHILNLPTPDHSAPSKTDLQKGIAFIADTVKKGGKVYIHCHYGEGRGPSMAIAYLMSQGMTFDDAYNHVRKIRTFVKLTPPQITRLKELEVTN